MAVEVFFFFSCSDVNICYIDLRCVDASTAGPDVRIQARGGTSGSTLSSSLNIYCRNSISMEM